MGDVAEREPDSLSTPWGTSAVIPSARNSPASISAWQKLKSKEQRA
jgi:hypothetical protein